MASDPPGGALRAAMLSMASGGLDKNPFTEKGVDKLRSEISQVLKRHGFDAGCPREGDAYQQGRQTSAPKNNVGQEQKNMAGPKAETHRRAKACKTSPGSRPSATLHHMAAATFGGSLCGHPLCFRAFARRCFSGFGPPMICMLLDHISFQGQTGPTSYCFYGFPLP